MKTLKLLVKKVPALHALYRRIKWSRHGPKEKDLRLLTRLSYREVVDVGANVGEYAYFLSKRAEKIYSFEPKESCQSVIRSLRLPNVELFSVGLARESGVVQLNVPVPEKGEVSSLGSIKPLGEAEESGSGRKTTRYNIEVKRFDDLDVSKSTRIDLVKIDVEGAELDVIDGMAMFLSRTGPILLIEIEQKRSPDWREVFSRLQQMGYRPYATFDGRFLEEVGSDFVASQGRGEHPDRRYVFNFFFLRPECSPEIAKLLVKRK